MSNSLNIGEKIKYVFGALEIAKRNREGRELEIIKSANRMVEQLENELADKDRQLAEARAEIEKATATEAERWAERLNWLHTKYGADCSGTDSADLLDCVEDEIKQVINSQSELIEQMLEALKIAAPCVKEIFGYHSKDYIEIKAALSAAERASENEKSE